MTLKPPAPGSLLPPFHPESPAPCRLPSSGRWRPLSSRGVWAAAGSARLPAGLSCCSPLNSRSFWEGVRMMPFSRWGSGRLGSAPPPGLRGHPRIPALWLFLGLKAALAQGAWAQARPASYPTWRALRRLGPRALGGPFVCPPASRPCKPLAFLAGGGWTFRPACSM